MKNNYSWKDKSYVLEDLLRLDSNIESNHQIILEMLIAIVLVLPIVFIVSYGFAKCIREITRGSVMCNYLMTNELI